MDFTSYAAVYYIYDDWSDAPIKYTYSGYASLAAAFKDVPDVLDEIARLEGFCAEDVYVEIDYYENFLIGSEQVDFENLSCYIDWHGNTYII